jgi:hypothetical protein
MVQTGFSIHVLIIYELAVYVRKLSYILDSPNCNHFIFFICIAYDHAHAVTNQLAHSVTPVHFLIMMHKLFQVGFQPRKCRYQRIPIFKGCDQQFFSLFPMAFL